MEKKALSCFLGHIEESKPLVEKIQNYLGEHLERDPIAIDYADAGDAAHLKNMLKEICEAFGL